MADVTYTEVRTKADALSRKDRQRLVDELSRGLQADGGPRQSVTEFFGKLGPCPTTSTRGSAR